LSSRNFAMSKSTAAMKRMLASRAMGNDIARRYPHLEQISGKPDYLSAIFSPKK